MKKWKEVSEDERSLQDCHTDPHSQRLELSLSLPFSSIAFPPYHAPATPRLLHPNRPTPPCSSPRACRPPSDRRQLRGLSRHRARRMSLLLLLLLEELAPLPLVALLLLRRSSAAQSPVRSLSFFQVSFRCAGAKGHSAAVEHGE